jgi:hypothetical protein
MSAFFNLFHIVGIAMNFKKTIFSKLASFSLCFTAALMLTACGSGGGGSHDDNGVVQNDTDNNSSSKGLNATLYAGEIYASDSFNLGSDYDIYSFGEAPTQYSLLVLSDGSFWMTFVDLEGSDSETRGIATGKGNLSHDSLTANAGFFSSWLSTEDNATYVNIQGQSLSYSNDDLGGEIDFPASSSGQTPWKITLDQSQGGFANNLVKINASLLQGQWRIFTMLNTPATIKVEADGTFSGTFDDGSIAVPGTHVDCTLTGTLKPAKGGAYLTAQIQYSGTQCDKTAINDAQLSGAGVISDETQFNYGYKHGMFFVVSNKDKGGMSFQGRKLGE